MRIVILGSYARSIIVFRGDLLRALVTQGHEVIVCVPNASQKIRDQLLEMKVAYKDLNLDRTGLNLVTDLRSFISLIHFFSVIKADIFLGYTIKPVIYGSLVARITRVRHIYSMITGLPTVFYASGFKGRIIKFAMSLLLKIALRYNDRVFFQNPDDVRVFQGRKILKEPQKVVIINGSGVDTEKFSVTDHPTSLTFLCIARLLKDKGIREYAEAAKIIRSRHPHIKFNFVGRVDNHPNHIPKNVFDSWVQSGSLENLGYLDDVRPAISRCSVYVLPSYHEGTPRTVLEAMSMGRAIITSDAPGCRETVQEGENGFLVPIKDVSNLVLAMEQFVHNPSLILKMGQKSRKIAVQKYDVHLVNDAMFRAMNLGPQ